MTEKYNEFEARFDEEAKVSSIRIRQVGNVEISVRSGKVWNSGKEDEPWEELNFYVNDNRGRRLAEIQVEKERSYKTEKDLSINQNEKNAEDGLADGN